APRASWPRTNVGNTRVWRPKRTRTSATPAAAAAIGADTETTSAPADGAAAAGVDGALAVVTAVRRTRTRPMPLTTNPVARKAPRSPYSRPRTAPVEYVVAAAPGVVRAPPAGTPRTPDPQRLHRRAR